MYICVKKDINCKVVGYDEKLARISCFWGAQVARASVGKCHYFFFLVMINPSQLMTSIHRPDKKALWTVVLPGSCYAWQISASVLYITNPESKMYFLQ